MVSSELHLHHIFFFEYMVKEITSPFTVSITSLASVQTTLARPRDKTHALLNFN